MTPDKPHSTFTDGELIARYHQSNDNRWLGHLLNRYSVLMLGVAMKYLKERNAAEDAVQQVFLKALTHFPQDPILNFKGWLYILMRNHCFQLLRDKTYHLTDETLVNLAEEDAVQHKQDEEFALGHLQEAIQELHSEQQVAITLFYLEKNSYEQICAKTGFNFMQVKSYIQNGKRNLKLLLLKKLKEVR